MVLNVRFAKSEGNRLGEKEKKIGRSFIVPVYHFTLLTLEHLP